ncbi:MAG: 50S ribosomal protein L4 [Pirellulales bacterium]|nr:50S ribosomal protein L4 [Pirellulales bacterium]
MVSLPIYDRTGAEVGQYEIDPARLAPRISKQLLHDAVVMYRNNLRQGSVKTKTRSEISGTSQKMYRQKGTGRARAGTRRSGVRRGGGHIHARQPRDWSYRLPKKALRAATRMALAARIADEEVTLIDKLAFEQPRTSEAASILEALKLNGTTVLVALPDHDVNTYRSLRNLAGVSVAPVAELNALSVLSPKRLLMTASALKAFEEAAIGGRAEESETSSPAAE